VAALADEMAAMFPDDMAALTVRFVDDGDPARWLETLTDEFTPAQTETVRLLVTRLQERA
jgi:hypothetical protein